jgi:hypothetical protein
MRWKIEATKDLIGRAYKDRKKYLSELKEECGRVVEKMLLVRSKLNKIVNHM